MKIKASPNMLVTLPCGDLKLMFDDNGIFDTKVFVKDFENKLIDRFDNSNFEKIEEAETETDKKEFTCKKCDFTCDSKGLLLAHYREHKKEGDS